MVSHLDPIQVERLKEIGASLRQRRLEQSLVLEEINAKTYIPIRILIALENGQVELLPEPVFIQGFIRRYGDVVGLDGTALAKSFPIQPVSASPASPKPETSQASGSLSYPAWLYGLVGVAVVGALLYLLSQIIPKRPQPQAQVSSPSPEFNQVIPRPAIPVATPQINVPPVQIAVKLTGESWVKVTIDNKPEFEGILQQGAQRTWAAQKNLILQAGNAGAVSVAFNKEDAKILGNPGEVKEVTFTANQAKPQPGTQ